MSDLTIERERLGELIYRAMYEHQGGQWSANETKDVWYDVADRLSRALVERVGGMFHDLPPGSFASAGTNVNTCIVTMEGPR